MQRDTPARIPRFHFSVNLMMLATFMTLAILVWTIELPRLWLLLAEF